MPHIIAISNQKGGVAKTTTAVNLAACLGQVGFRCLLVDMDPQANATSACGLDPNNLESTVYDSLLDALPAPVYDLNEQFARLAVLPASVDLAGAELELMDKEGRETALQRALTPVQNDFDYIIIDCPPSLGLLTLNALVVANWVLIPVQAEYFALEGLSRMVLTIQRVNKKYNPDLQMLGVLPTMFDGRTNLAQQVLEELRRAFPEKVFSTLIGRSVRLSEAPSFGQPIIYYDGRSTGAEQYQRLCQEVLDVCEKTSPGPRA